MELHTLLFFAAAGVVGGLLLGMIGVGMALITVPLLTFALPHFGVSAADAPLIALSTSLAVAAVGSVSSLVSHHRLGNIEWGVVRTSIPASLAGVIAGSLLVAHLPGALLRWVFAASLVFVAWKMLAAPQARGLQGGRAAAADIAPATYRWAAGSIGLAGSMIGAGGGIFMIPFLSNRGFTMVRAVAVSTAISFPVALLGSLIHTTDATHGAAQMLGSIYMPAFWGLGVASLASAPFGAKLGHKLPQALLRKGFAVVLLVLAVRMCVG